jgi:toxin ParE1/3/4
MRKPIVVRPRADRDIDDIFAFLRRGSPDAAERFLDAIETVRRLLCENPGIGSARHAEICPELPCPLRFYPLADFPRILVYYMERPDALEVVRIWDAARGLQDLRVEEPRPEYRAPFQIGRTVSLRDVQRRRKSSADYARV